MERRIPLIIFFIFFSLFFYVSNTGSSFKAKTFFNPSMLYAQSLSQERTIQLYLWAGLDAYPESYAEEKENHQDNKPFAYPIRQIKELAPFILEGMIYGWEFDYTPSDKMRGVSEFFERKSIKVLGSDAKKINYKKPIIDDGKLCVWIEFTRSEEMSSYLTYWSSLRHDKMRGRGTAPLEKGFAGIQEACDLALKNAVREYFRTQTKNKPKQITGKVLLRNLPRISAVSGKYIVDLDFFVEKDRMILYRQY